MKCWHGDVAGEGHEWERPKCPEKPVSPLIVSAAKAAEVTGDAPGIMAILLAAGGAAAAPRYRR